MAWLTQAIGFIPRKATTRRATSLSATGTNNANFDLLSPTDPLNLLTAVGAFAASPGVEKVTVTKFGQFDNLG